VAPFLNKVVRALDRVWIFVGGTSIVGVDVERAPQLVVDVGRMAELGAAGVASIGGGFWFVTREHEHAGAGTLTNVMNAYAPPAGQAVNGYEVLDDEWLWYIRGFMTAAVGANMTGGTIAYHNDSSAILAGVQDDGDVAPGLLLLTQFSSMGAIGLGTTTEAGLPDNAPGPPIPFPRPAGVGSDNLRFTSLATGATNVVMIAMLWKGKIGTYPPGYN